MAGQHTLFFKVLRHQPKSVLIAWKDSSQDLLHGVITEARIYYVVLGQQSGFKTCCHNKSNDSLHGLGQKTEKKRKTLDNTLFNKDHGYKGAE